MYVTWAEAGAQQKALGPLTLGGVVGLLEPLGLLVVCVEGSPQRPSWHRRHTKFSQCRERKRQRQEEGRGEDPLLGLPHPLSFSSPGYKF